MAQLKALKQLNLSTNKLPSTAVDFIIKTFPQLTFLGIGELGLTGALLHACSCTISNTLIYACSPTKDYVPAQGS